MINGTQISTALAFAELFDAGRIGAHSTNWPEKA